MALRTTLDFFLGEIFRFPIQKVLDPNDPVDFQAICQQLAKATAGLAQPEEAKALKAALAALDVDWKGMNAATKAKVVLAAKQAVNPVKSVLPKVEEHYEANAIKLGQQTKGSTKKTFGFSISPDLTAVQVKSLQAVAFSSANYVRDEYGKRSDAFSMKAKQIVVEELAKGTPNKEIVDRLHTELTSQQFNRSRSYWQVASMAFANRARTFVNLDSYQEAGITEFIFDSVLDQRTSHICRFMHGRSFPVAHALAAYGASEKGDVKVEQPWVQQTSNDKGQPVLYVKGANGEQVHVATVTQSAMGQADAKGKFSGKGDGDLAAMGIMTPPLHGRCRSTIRPIESSTTVSVPQTIDNIPEPPPPPTFSLTHPEEAPAPAAAPAAPAFAPMPEEQGGFTFGPGGISMKPLEVKPLDPAEPPVKAYVPLKDKVGGALDKLKALNVDPEFGTIPNPVPYSMPKQGKENLFGFAGVKNAVIEAAEDAGLTKKANKLISSLQSTSYEVMADQVEQYIKNPKLLLKANVKVVKIGNQSYVVSGHEAVAAAQLLDKWKIPVTEINLKQAEAELKAKAKAAALAPKAPPIPPAPTPPPVPPPPPPAAPLKGPIDPKDILAEKTNRPGGGSNGGAFYKGKDGVERFVKFYDEPAQAHGEVLANALYKELGFGSPEAVTWKDPATGKQVYAAKLVEGSILGTSPGKDKAKKFFDGFAADVLCANWDAAGQSGDNAFLLKNGQIIRLDNGGSFLMRAQKGRKKDPSAKPGGKNPILNGVGELETFFPGSAISNPGYHALAKQAGYSSVEDFKASFVEQVKQIDALKARYGTWSNFVSQYAPGLTGPDRQLVVEMLEARHKGLQDKVTELMAPPPPAPPKVEGWVHRAPGISGTAPAKGLKIDKLPETPPVPKFNASGDRLDTTLWGESRSALRQRAKKNVEEKIGYASRSAIVDFGGSDYGSIRDSEERGSPNTNSKRISEAYKKAIPEPCTVFRGLHGLPKEVVESWIQNTGTFRLGRGNTGATSSSSWDPNVAIHSFMGGVSESGSSYKVLFQIHQKSGIAIETFAPCQSEREILLSREMEYRVVSVARWKGKQRIVVIELEEI